MNRNFERLNNRLGRLSRAIIMARSADQRRFADLGRRVGALERQLH